jgi:tRNA U34 5-methylaminomethyl-2-thiouridine-forming methyltransferase MnmC
MFEQMQELLDAAQEHLTDARADVRSTKNEEGIQKAFTALGEVTQVADQLATVTELLIHAWFGDEKAVAELEKLFNDGETGGAP